MAGQGLDGARQVEPQRRQVTGRDRCGVEQLGLQTHGNLVQVVQEVLQGHRRAMSRGAVVWSPAPDAATASLMGRYTAWLRET